MHTPDDSDGPAVRCPGRSSDQPCDDYPNGACTRCVERAREEER